MSSIPTWSACRASRRKRGGCWIVGKTFPSFFLSSYSLRYKNTVENCFLLGCFPWLFYEMYEYLPWVNHVSEQVCAYGLPQPERITLSMRVVGRFTPTVLLPTIYSNAGGALPRSFPGPSNQRSPVMRGGGEPLGIYVCVCVMQSDWEWLRVTLFLCVCVFIWIHSFCFRNDLSCPGKVCGHFLVLRPFECFLSFFFFFVFLFYECFLCIVNCFLRANERTCFIRSFFSNSSMACFSRGQVVEGECVRCVFSCVVARHCVHQDAFLCGCIVCFCGGPQIDQVIDGANAVIEGVNGNASCCFVIRRLTNVRMACLSLLSTCVLSWSLRFLCFFSWTGYQAFEQGNYGGALQDAANGVKDIADIFNQQ